MPSNRRTKAELDAFLKPYAPNVRQIALKLRARVFDAVPDALEQIDLTAHLLGYGLSATYKEMICVIILYKTYVNFGFPRGTELPDPNNLLVGTGKRARHIKITAMEEADNPALVALLEASAGQVRPAN